MSLHEKAGMSWPLRQFHAVPGSWMPWHRDIEPRMRVTTMPFPFNPSFDPDIFRADVERVWNLRRDNNGIEDYLRERGLRYIIEAPPPMTLESVGNLVREILHPEFSVEPLFEDFGGNPVPEDLRSFYLATLRGVLPSDLTQSPYEGAYALKAQIPSLNVEPDLVYTSFLAASAGGSGGGTAPGPALAQPALADKAWSLRNIRAENAWNLFTVKGTQPGQGISIAHLDTGWTDHDDVDQANFDHARAKDYIVRRSSARDVLGYLGNPGHGTKTASVIMSRGGVASNWPPGTLPPGEITGVAPYSTYVPIRCIMSVFIFFNGDVARALRYATALRCDVASMSLGGRPMRALRRALSDAVRNHVLVVCAAGNKVSKVSMVVWPARYPDALAIAASNILDGHWSGSCRGRRVDISAPGEDVWKADPDPKGKAVSMGSGTSYATAHMAGAAGLWLSYHGKAVLQSKAQARGMSLQDLFRFAVKTSARVPPVWDAKNYGDGILNVKSLLQTNLAVATPATASSVGANVDLDVAALICEDEPDRGKWLLGVIFGAIFRVDMEKVDAMLDVFGHELVNVLLDNPELLDRVRAAAKSATVSEELQAVRLAVLNKVSTTLSNTVI